MSTKRTGWGSHQQDRFAKEAAIAAAERAVGLVEADPARDAELRKLRREVKLLWAELRGRPPTHPNPYPNGVPVEWNGVKWVPIRAVSRTTKGKR